MNNIATGASGGAIGWYHLDAAGITRPAAGSSVAIEQCLFLNNKGILANHCIRTLLKPRQRPTKGEAAKLQAQGTQPGLAAPSPLRQFVLHSIFELQLVRKSVRVLANAPPRS